MSYRDYRRQSKSPSYQRKNRGRDSHERSRHKRSRSKSLDRHKKRKERRSNSRSPQRQSYRARTEKTQQQIRQDMEQKIRVAFRNGNFDSDPEIQKISANLPRQKIQVLYEQAVRPSLSNEPILVRQLYISGLPQLSEGLIHSIMSGYGQIQSIEICKNFAFVKFYKVEDASNACADYHNINIRLHHTQNANFKMFFADHLKRWNVVSNNLEYEIKDHLIPVIYASIKNDPKFANEQYLYSIFSKFGFVKSLSVKQNQSPGPKVYALIEYQTLEMAMRARQKMQQSRDKLGDRRSQLTLLLDHQKVIKSYPNVANQLKYQKKPIRNANPPPMNPSLFPQIPRNNINIEPQFEPDPSVYDLLIKMAEQQNNQTQVDWSGFFTRNNKMKVAVDLILEQNMHVDFKEHHLNISHRAHLESYIFTDPPILIGRFKATNSASYQLFQSYIRYFQQRQRAGIVQTSTYIMYLIPPRVGPPHQYEIAKDELLALFFPPMLG